MIGKTIMVMLSASLLAVVAVLVVGRWSERTRPFSDRMIAQWKAALAIAVLYLVSYSLGGGFNAYHIVGATSFFCQSLLGLALARSIADFEPLPVAQAVVQRKHVWRNIVLTLVIALLVVPVGWIASSLGMQIGERVFDETSDIDMGDLSMLPSNPWSLLFVFLAAGGIAEETMFRLLLLSLLWRLTRRRWLAIGLSAVVFGAYHLSPINRLAHIFWQFPASQFLSSMLGGIVIGILYVKRGYETAVLEHTLSNWIPFALFTLSQQEGSLSVDISGDAFLMIVGGILGTAVLALIAASLAWIYRRCHIQRPELVDERLMSRQSNRKGE